MRNIEYADLSDLFQGLWLGGIKEGEEQVIYTDAIHKIVNLVRHESTGWKAEFIKCGRGWWHGEATRKGFFSSFKKTFSRRVIVRRGTEQVHSEGVELLHASCSPHIIVVLVSGLPWEIIPKSMCMCMDMGWHGWQGHGLSVELGGVRMG